MRAASSRRHTEPHAIQAEQKQTSEAANFHYTNPLPPSPPVAPTMDPLFSLKHVPMTEQTIPNILSVWLLGGGLVIISVSCYYMSGLGQGGVGSCQQMKKGERGLEDFC